MPANDTVKVWDPLVRVFHWSLVASFAIAYVSAEEIAQVHTLAGYTIAGLVAVRVVWGFVGTTHARFSDFVRGPGAVLGYLKDLVAHRAPRYLGHNPAGGAMIIALLLGLVATVVTGMAVYGLKDAAGPMAFLAGGGEAMEEGLEEVHEFFGNFTLFLAMVHVAAVIISNRLHGENLVIAMLTGRKARDL